MDPFAKPRYKVRVGVAPRNQPFYESMQSLAVCVAKAQIKGIAMVVQTVLFGVPGFQNWGPTLCNFLEDADATHVFAAADDMIYPLNMFERLLEADKDIISGVYRKSHIQEITPANWVEDADTCIAHLKEGGVYQSAYASGHTMLIKRAVIEKMIVDYPELAYKNEKDGKTHHALFMPMIKDGICLQDDWAFSVRARESGFTIWNDYGCKCAHWAGAFIEFPDLGEANGSKQ